MRRIDDSFRVAMIAAYRSQGYTSYRHAEYRTGIACSTFSRMMKGEVPGRGVLQRWATAIGEPVNKWLALAGHPPIPGGDQAMQVSQLRPPETAPPSAPAVSLAVLQAIAEAATREDKVQLAFEYLRRPELGLRMGAQNMHSLPTEAKLAIIRLWETLTGNRLLPPEVV